MRASEHILIDISLIGSASLRPQDVSQLNQHNRALNLHAGLASPKLRKDAAGRYILSFLSLSRPSSGQAQRQFRG